MPLTCLFLFPGYGEDMATLDSANPLLRLSDAASQCARTAGAGARLGVPASPFRMRGADVLYRSYARASPP